MLKVIHNNLLFLRVYDPVFPDPHLAVFFHLQHHIPLPGGRGHDLYHQIRRPDDMPAYLAPVTDDSYVRLQDRLVIPLKFHIDGGRQYNTPALVLTHMQ